MQGCDTTTVGFRTHLSYLVRREDGSVAAEDRPVRFTRGTEDAGPPLYRTGMLDDVAETRAEDVGELLPGGPISLVIIEDNRLLRDGLCALLGGQAGFHVLEAGADSSVLTRLPALGSPTVLLLDVGLRDDDSLAICVRVHERFPSMRVIVMGMAPPHDDITAFVHTGVAGFIMKDATPEEFATTIRHVAMGAQTLPRALTDSLFAQITRQPQHLPFDAVEESVRLTAREREIVDLLSEGLSNKEIAARLHIAIHTVKSHVHNTLEKLSLHSRLEVAAFSRRPGRRS